jgi:hypothetical protein
VLAEVVSETDEVAVPGTNRRWFDVKHDLYRSHEHCQAVLIVSQDRMQVTLDIRTEAGCNSKRSGKPITPKERPAAGNVVERSPERRQGSRAGAGLEIVQEAAQSGSARRKC